MAASLTSSRIVVLVEVVGAVALDTSSKECADVQYAAVVPAKRGKGLGESLADAAHGVASSNGCHSMRLAPQLKCRWNYCCGETFPRNGPPSAEILKCRWSHCCAETRPRKGPPS